MGRLHHRYLSPLPGFNKPDLMAIGKNSALAFMSEEISRQNFNIDRYFSFGLLAIMAIGLKTSLIAAPVSPFLHNTSFDGGLHWSLDILHLKLDKNLYWDIEARHVTSECKSLNTMLSRWEIQGIESYLLFDNADIRWVSGLGNSVRFARSEVEQNGLSKTADGCVLMKTNDETYVIKDPANNLWSYKRGLLAQIEIESGIVVQCQFSEGIISDLSVKGRRIFSTHWHGNSLHIFPASEKAVVIKYDNCRQQIQSISRETEKSPEVEFDYAGKLVAAIRLGGGKLAFTWNKVPFSFFPDASLDYSHYLKSDGVFTYKHEYMLGNYILKSTDKYGNCEAKVLNLKNETITYYK